MAKGYTGQKSMKTLALKECCTGFQHIVHKHPFISGTARQGAIVNGMIDG
jgi:hypothetical protein